LIDVNLPTEYEENAGHGLSTVANEIPLPTIGRDLHDEHVACPGSGTDDRHSIDPLFEDGDVALMMNQELDELVFEF
jgi:hypothetical protein